MLIHVYLSSGGFQAENGDCQTGYPIIVALNDEVFLIYGSHNVNPDY
jgi:hypothetical protein